MRCSQALKRNKAFRHRKKLQSGEDKTCLDQKALSKFLCSGFSLLSLHKKFSPYVRTKFYIPDSFYRVYLSSR